MTPQEIAEQTRDMAQARREAVKEAASLLDACLDAEVKAHGEMGSAYIELRGDTSYYRGKLMSLVTELAAKAYP